MTSSRREKPQARQEKPRPVKEEKEVAKETTEEATKEEPKKEPTVKKEQPKVEKEEPKAKEEEKVEPKPVVDQAEELKSKTIVQLKALAKERGLSGYSTLKKADLIDLLK